MKTLHPFAAGFVVLFLCGAVHAGTRLALVSGQSGAEIKNTLDIATALLSQDPALQLLDRAEVSRVLREQELSLAGLVGAEHAIKAGQLLHVELFAVLEGTLTKGTQATPSFGLVVFDARTGVRYADSALAASNAVSAASATAAGVRAAVAKSRRNPQDLHTVGVLLVRNADLPRQLDGLCDSVGLLLERELTASPGIAVLERRRLEQLNQERRVAPDAAGNRLLASLRMIELDIGQEGAGLRGTLALAGADGTRTHGITASVPARDPAALAHLLADRTERFLKAPSGGVPADRGAEAARFHHEYVLLLQHHDYAAAVRTLDAALALAPQQKDWQREMVRLLPDAAIEFVHPGGQNYSGGFRLYHGQPTAGDLASCLALGHRGADLLLDLAREATSLTKPGEQLPEVLDYSYRSRLCSVLEKLTDVDTNNPAIAAEIAALAGKERTLRMEVLEPFLRTSSVNAATFGTYSRMVDLWLSGAEWNLYSSSSLANQRRQDDVLALSHWVETSHRLNPPDGSGNYLPIAFLFLFKHYQGDQVKEFRQRLEQDPDPVIRLYARLGRVASSMANSHSASDRTPAVEREFRLYAQDLLFHGEAVQPGPLRNHVWQALNTALGMLRNHAEGWKEYLEACRFAFDHQEIQPELFRGTASILNDARYRKVPEQLEVVNGALKLIRERPEAYPKARYPQNERDAVLQEFQQKRDQLVAELAGIKPNAPPALSLWSQSVCLLDLAKPIGGFAWLFKPVIQDGQVFAVALGIQPWGAPEDSLQLVRVPIEGGPASFLGRSGITGIDWGPNGRSEIKRGPQARFTKVFARVSPDVTRAACTGAGCYFAATCSGVYIFPLDGGPVLRLGATNGLPSDDIHAVAFLDGKLYIGAGEVERAGYLAVYDPATRQISVLASSRRSERLSPLDDQPPFHTLCLVADPIRKRLLAALSSVPAPANQVASIPSGSGIWTYRPSTGEFKQLASLRLTTMPRQLMRFETWAGLVNSNTLAVKAFRTSALLDLSSDRLRSVYGSSIEAAAADALWKSPISGQPGTTTVAGPFLIRDGWFYSARPFERRALANGRRQEISPLRTEYPFAPKESLQLLDDGKRVLAADQYSIWLLEFPSAL